MAKERELLTASILRATAVVYNRIRYRLSCLQDKQRLGSILVF